MVPRIPEIDFISVKMRQFFMQMYQYDHIYSARMGELIHHCTMESDDKKCTFDAVIRHLEGFDDILFLCIALFKTKNRTSDHPVRLFLNLTKTHQYKDE